MKPCRFALDQGFPLPIVRCLQEYLPEIVELSHLLEIDPQLCQDIADWEIMLALHNWDPRFDGLITVDSSMLSQPKEMCVVNQTRLTLIVPDSAGHDPLMATGLLLTYLPRIAKNNNASKGQVWCLKTSQSPQLHQSSGQFLNKMAQQRGQEMPQFFRDHQISDAELATSPLDST